MKILVVGGTGFAGSHIAKEAARRGHELVSLGRTEPQEKVEGVSYVIGSALDADLRGQLVGDADVVVAAISPRGDMLGTLGRSKRPRTTARTSRSPRRQVTVQRDESARSGHCIPPVERDPTCLSDWLWSDSRP